MFLRSKNPLPTFLLSYRVRTTSKIEINFRYRRYLKVLMIVSYEFLKFLHYLCFREWGIHFWYSHWATTFRCPRKSKSTSGTGGSWRYCWLCLINFWNFLTFYVFEVGESISDIPTELLCWVTSKIQINFRYSRYWWFCLMNFWNVFSIYVFKVKESITSIPTELPCLGDLKNF